MLAANGLASDGQPLPTSSGAGPVPGKSKSSQSSDPVHLYSLCLRERSLDSPDPVASTKVRNDNESGAWGGGRLVRVLTYSLRIAVSHWARRGNIVASLWRQERQY